MSRRPTLTQRPTAAQDGAVGRWRVRHFVFYQDGQQHELLAVSDVSKLLVEEERINWQRLLRVLGHELNNSLVPIKNMAQTPNTAEPISVTRRPILSDK